jgi:hypothetical protein
MSGERLRSLDKEGEMARFETEEEVADELDLVGI